MQLFRSLIRTPYLLPNVPTNNNLSIIHGFVSNYMNFKVVRIKNFNLISI